MQANQIPPRESRNSYGETTRRYRVRRKWREDEDKEVPAERLERWGDVLSSEKANNALVDIAAVLQFTDDYDDEFLRPTDQAFSLTCRLVRSAYSEIREFIPSLYAVADGDGGLRVRWTQGDKEIRLACHALSVEKTYIYHQRNSDYNVDYNINADKLVYWLRWLISP